MDRLEFSERPSLLFLGRLDAVKRPWIAFELAKRHPDIDFLIAGQAHNPELMGPWFARYQHVPNLHMVGHVDGPAKDRLLRSCWGLPNTSVHEAEPVSLLEALAYGKSIVSCHDPDEAVTKYGFYTGEVHGEGLDEDSLQRIDARVRAIASDTSSRVVKRMAVRAEMLRNHTFAAFRSHLAKLISAEGL